jgi:hypothetical protein
VRLALKASRAQLPIQGPLLSLSLAITPGCTSQQQDRTLTPGAQVRLFFADKDASPHERCMVYVEKMKAAGGDADFKLYANSFHTFAPLSRRSTQAARTIALDLLILVPHCAARAIETSSLLVASSTACGWAAIRPRPDYSTRWGDRFRLCGCLARTERS